MIPSLHLKRDGSVSPLAVTLSTGPSLHPRLQRLLWLMAGCALLAPLPVQAQTHVGATTPFTTLEAEAGALGGGATIRSFVIGSPVPTVATLELEASGGAVVELKTTGESVAWTNPVANANTIVIRSSIPDAPNGGGMTATIDLYVDGVLRQALTVSSMQSWVYRNSTTNPDDPNGGGMPFHFYNEDRAFITGAPIAAGSIIKLQRDAANTAAVYDIDCIDLEAAPAPLTQPANSLSIVTYGADPTFTTDSTTAIRNTVSAARAQGKSVWIPQGTFIVNNLSPTPIDLTGVAVHGAGMWYSTIYKKIPLPPPTLPWRSELQVGSGTTLTDIFVDSNAIYRGVGGAGGDSSGITAAGAGGWLIDHVWVQHCDAQWLTGTNGTIQDSRVADSWADAINLNNGNTPNPDKLGINLTMQNNFVRGGGDDGLTTYSDSGSSGLNTEMDGTRILNNTSVATYWANGLRVAGGKNVLVQNNLITDPAANNGMDVSVFGTTGHPLDSATITGNVILRGGGWNGTNRYGMSVGSPSSGNFANAYTNATISNNTIQDSRRAGVVIGTKLENVTFTSNTVVHPAAQGFWITSGVTGTGAFTTNTVSNLISGKVAYQNDSPTTFLTTLTDNSWQPPLVPTGLAATAGVTQVGLSWTASNRAVTYSVKRATVSGGPYTTISSPAATSYTDSGLTVGTTYYYVVSAVNVNGESGNSIQVSATTGDFALASSPGSQTSQRGGTATFTLTMTPVAVTSLPNAVTFTASGQPSGATVTLSPSSLPSGSGAASVTLTIQVPQTAILQDRLRGRGLPLAALALLLLPLGAGMTRSSQRTRVRIMLLLMTVTGFATMLTGCGGGTTTNTPARNYNIIVTATSGAISHSTTVTLTVP
jgi:hypothetical protein